MIRPICVWKRSKRVCGFLNIFLIPLSIPRLSHGGIYAAVFQRAYQKLLSSVLPTALQKASCLNQVQMYWSTAPPGNTCIGLLAASLLAMVKHVCVTFQGFCSFFSFA